MFNFKNKIYKTILIQDVVPYTFILLGVARIFLIDKIRLEVAIIFNY